MFKLFLLTQAWSEEHCSGCLRKPTRGWKDRWLRSGHCTPASAGNTKKVIDSSVWYYFQAKAVNHQNPAMFLKSVVMQAHISIYSKNVCIGHRNSEQMITSSNIKTSV